MNVNEIIKQLYKGEIAGVDSTQINLYWSWYKGFNEAFHNTRVYNGQNFIYLTKKSLQMAKKIAETWADLLINEKCDIATDDNAKAAFDKIFNKGKFWTKANRTIEWAFALGYAAIIGEITADRKMNFVTINARNIVPLKIENEQITECAFYKVLSDQKTRITLWTKTRVGHYQVRTIDYNKDGDALEDTVLQTAIDKPLYMILKPNIVENNENNNFGMSVFANSIDTLKAIDTKYDGLDFEFIGGRKRVYVSLEAMKVVMGSDGKSSMSMPFDPLDSTYYNTGDTGDDGKPLIQEGGGELRSEQYIAALNFELGILSQKTGLGYGYFRINPTGQVTATQVVSENSDLYTTKNKHEILIRDELIQFVTAIAEYSNAYCELKVPNFDGQVDILFDDSIIEDKQTQKANDLKEVAAGVMSYVDFAKRWEALDEDTAKGKYLYLDIAARAEKIRPLLAAKLMTPEIAIKLIYQQELQSEQESLIEYLKTDDLNIDDGEFE